MSNTVHTKRVRTPLGPSSLAATEATRTEAVVRRCCHAGAIVVAGIAFIVLCGVADKPVTWPLDYFSDMDVLTSGENFAEHGLISLHLLPVHYIGGISDNPQYYLHYPPFPNIMNGVLRILGVESLAVMRGFCAALFVIGLYCMYRAFATVIGHIPAVCGLAFITSTAYVAGYGLSIHQHTYNMFFMGLFFLLFFKAVEAEKRTACLWAACWIVLVLEALSSFEFIAYPQIFAWTYVIATRRFRKNLPLLIVLGSAAIFGMGLHLIQNISAVGWTEVLADRFGFRNFVRESRWTIWSQFPQLLTQRTAMSYYWPWPVLVILALQYLFPVHYKLSTGEASSKAIGLVLAAMLAGIGWYVFVPGHAFRHPHTVNQLLPLAFITMGGGLAIIGRWLFQRHIAAPLRVIAGVGLLAVVYGQYTTISSRLSSKGALPTSVMAEAIGSDTLPNNVGVMFNTAAEAQFRYFIRRPAWRSLYLPIPFPESVKACQRYLPTGWLLKYYVLFAPFDSDTRDTYQYMVRNCPGQIAAVDGFENPKRYMLLFDMSELHKPPDERKGLSAEVRDNQLRGVFAPWTIPDLPGRIQRAWHNQAGG